VRDSNKVRLAGLGGTGTGHGAARRARRTGGRGEGVRNKTTRKKREVSSVGESELRSVLFIERGGEGEPPGDEKRWPTSIKANNGDQFIRGE
jgi:hypothetical protein